MMVCTVNEACRLSLTALNIRINLLIINILLSFLSFFKGGRLFSYHAREKVNNSPPFEKGCRRELST
jgi:hypothetical protein